MRDTYKTQEPYERDVKQKDTRHKNQTKMQNTHKTQDTYEGEGKQKDANYITSQNQERRGASIADCAQETCTM